MAVPPVTRPRSNALAGPSDPRRPDTQKMFLAALNSAKPVADSLRSFLRKVYDNKSLMGDPSHQKWVNGKDGKPVSPSSQAFGDTLSDKLYAMYTSEATVPSGRTRKEMREFMEKVAGLKANYPGVLDEIKSQNYDKTPDEMLKYHGADFIQVCNDFIFFYPVNSGNAAIRVYANAKWNKLLDVIGKLLGHIKTQPANHGMSNFKIAGPAMAKRADTMVIYCISSKAADAIATRLLKLGDAFDMAVPEMTSRKDGRLGISTGAEPKWQATGLGPHMGAKYENNPDLQAEHGKGSAAYAPQSFGTVRCQAIAAAILNFQMNLDQVSDTFEWFCKFVSVAFTGLGLDPTNPGD